MDIEFIDRLSDDLRALVASIETKAGLEIEVAIDESRAGRYSNEPDPMACVANEFEAQLLIPSPDTFSDGAVLHELLHIQRFLVEGIPQIAVCEHYWRPDLESLFTQLDNNLEHLVIVPRELLQRPERKDRWIGVMTRVLTQLQSIEIATANRDFLAIYGCFFVEHVLDDKDLLTHYIAALHSYNLVARASEFSLATAAALTSKEATVRAWAEQFNLPREFLCLDYFDSRKGTRHQRHLS